MRYEAFISYKHGGIDEEVAVQVQKEIEKYRIPAKLAKKLGKKRIGRVFRDADELRASADLGTVIKQALDESEWLIVIASPRYVKSPWCLEEIEYFLKIRPRERIIVILTEGEPEDSFPKILTYEEINGESVEIEPLAVDVRSETSAGVKKTVKAERLKFIASMLDVAFDDLRQRQRERRLRRISAAVAVVFLALSSVAAVIMKKNIELNNAYDALDNSMQQTLKGESYYLSEYADGAYMSGDINTAIKLSLKALPDDIFDPKRPYVTQSMRSLTRSLGIYDYTGGYKAGAYFEREDPSYDIRSSVSEDGKRIRIETYSYAAGNMLNREVKVCSLPDGNTICGYRLAPVSRTSDHPEACGSYLSKDGTRLTYIAEDGLKCVNVDTGEVIYTGRQASELIVGDKEGVTVSIDYALGKLNTYDAKGKEIISCDIGDDMNYTLGSISPGEGMVCLSANTEDVFGVITIDLATGQSGFVDMPGLCTYVRFIDDDRLCFLLSDETDGLKHIVKYSLSEGDQSYLCNADWDMSSMTLSDERVYYFHDNSVYEVSCNSEKGKILWEQVFSSAVISVKADDGVVSVSCQDGVTYFYEEDGKRRINIQQGNGEPVYLLGVDKRVAQARDFWGKSLRVYLRQDNTDREGVRIPLDNIITAEPEQWYTFETTGEDFALGLHNGIENRLAVFGEADFRLKSKASLSSLGVTSFDNISLSVYGDKSIGMQDYDDFRLAHYDIHNLKNVLDIRGYDYYYYDETGNNLCISYEGKLTVYDTSTGQKLDEQRLPDGYDRGVALGDIRVYGDDEHILIDDGSGEIRLDDAQLSAYDLAKKLVIYRSPNGEKWFAYSVGEKRVVCEGSSGTYANMTFFGENRYVMIDYGAVYDMNTWKKVLDVSALGNSVYGVKTTEKLPYFVVWCQENEQVGADRPTGSSVAYLYEKDGDGEIVGDIPGFVTMTSAGEIVVYDSERSLYRFGLHTPDELLRMARQKTGDEDLTDYQKEKYHLFDR